VATHFLRTPPVSARLVRPLPHGFRGEVSHSPMAGRSAMNRAQWIGIGVLVFVAAILVIDAMVWMMARHLQLSFHRLHSAGYAHNPTDEVTK
jgi:hypothetical protein